MLRRDHETPERTQAARRARRVGGDPRPARARRLSSSSRMLGILDLFTPDQPLLGADAIAARLGCSTATAYRYAADLCAVGLLARFSASFTLGPRIIELDYMIRQRDPLLQAGLPIVRQLRDRTGFDVMVTEMFADTIVTVHHERGHDPTTVSYTRGRRLPLLRGAGSKAILSGLPVAHQQRLYARHRPAVAQAGLGESWPEFRSALAALRRQGHALSDGELDFGNIGIGVPLSSSPGDPPGSLVAVIGRPRWEIADRARVVQLIIQAGAAIATAMRECDAAIAPVPGVP